MIPVKLQTCAVTVLSLITVRDSLALVVAEAMPDH
jgi:hypothetical protein